MSYLNQDQIKQLRHLRFFSDNDFIRCPYPEHPNRCQHVNKQGQCNLLAIDGQRFCKAHIGSLLGQQRKNELKKYRLKIWGQRVAEFSNDGELKSLNEEIGVVRLTLEHLLNMCETPTDLIVNSPRIEQLTRQIEKLVTTCAALEKQSGAYLDKTSLVQIAGQIIQIISDNIDDTEVFQTISNEITELIANARSTKTSS